jgi:hypothetical protein
MRSEVLLLILSSIKLFTRSELPVFAPMKNVDHKRVDSLLPGAILPRMSMKQCNVMFFYPMVIKSISSSI